MDRLRREIESFRGTWKGHPLWAGGYWEGDPLDPMGGSAYGPAGYLSVLHAVYLRCIKPYVGPETAAVEIGPGRGAWTRALLAAREVWALDVLSAEHNGFWEYVGRHPHVRYVQVEDFSFRELPDDRFDYLFSFGCLCHASFAGISEYLRNLRPKLRPGTECFVMVADYDKANAARRNADAILVSRRALPAGKRGRLVRLAWRLSARDGVTWGEMTPDRDDEPSTGRWYHAGTERTCALLEELGYTVVDPDVGVSHRDPVIHFRR